MAQVVTIGLDLAKSVFQVYGVDAAGQVVVRRQIRRSHQIPTSCAHLRCRVEAGSSGPAALWPATSSVAARGRTHGRTDQLCRKFSETLADGEPHTGSNCEVRFSLRKQTFELLEDMWVADWRQSGHASPPPARGSPFSSDDGRTIRRALTGRDLAACPPEIS